MEVLKPYQEKIVERIMTTPKVAIWAQCGMGKSFALIRAWEYLLFPKLLIIAPKMVCATTWRQQFKKFAPNARVNFVNGNADNRKVMLETEADAYVMSRDFCYWLWTTYGKKIHFDMVCLDEASSFKNISSQRTKGIKWYCQAATNVVELTATPAGNGYVDLWSQIYLLDGGKRLGTSVTRYRQKYFIPQKIANFYVYRKPKTGAVEEINNLISDITISLDNQGNLTLPDKVETVVKFEMDSKTRKTYKIMRREYVLNIGSLSAYAINSASICQKLMQISCGFCYTDDKQVISFSKHKIEWVKEFLETIWEPVLIFANFRRDIEELQKIGCEVLNTGEKILRFQSGKIPAGVCQPQSLAYGVNLQENCSCIVFYSPVWSFEIHTQAIRRVYRQGVKNTVRVIHLITEETIEERIVEAIQNKSLTQKSLLDAVRLEIDSVEKEKLEKYVYDIRGEENRE